MWQDFPNNEKEKYRLMILAYASLSRVFSQKNSDDERLVPIVNSKYQETVFTYCFNGTEEDIGNTSFDVSVRKHLNGKEHKYLVGIKTFGLCSGFQKIAQFKAKLSDWSGIIQQCNDNAKNLNNRDEINAVNNNLYKMLATDIATIRNERINSSVENLRGFDISDHSNVESVYHVLMPANLNDSRRMTGPFIAVGETSYSKIDISHIMITGCTGITTPANFEFNDGIHEYRFTSADCQLYMNFDNTNIILDKWSVKYLADAFDEFIHLGERIYGSVEKPRYELSTIRKPEIIESHSWLIVNNNSEVEQFSGFNSFNGVGLKSTRRVRLKQINELKDKFYDAIPRQTSEEIIKGCQSFLLDPSTTDDERNQKVRLRNYIIKIAEKTENKSLIETLNRILHRPEFETYIPIPQAKKFHSKYPDFFAKDAGKFKDDGTTLLLSKEKRGFNLVFEPSGNKIRAYIVQDSGKGIESVNSQAVLGKWLLRKVFRLKPYEPLTAKKLNELGFNAIRLYKLDDSEDVHIRFIWIDMKNKPNDCIN